MPLSAIFNVSALGATSKAVGPLDLLGDDELPQALGEVHHPLFLADPDRVASLMSSSLRISFRTVGFIRMISTSGTRVCRWRGPVLGRRQQLLGDDRLEVERQVLPHRRVHVLGEQVEDAADRRGGGGGVDRPEDQVAGLGRVHGGVERVAVAHLAHQDDVGVLPHGVLQGRVPVDDVDADLALVDDRLVVLEGELDRVLDGDDVQRSRSLMYWSIEAIVVDLPEPVTPARMMIPWSYWRSRPGRAGGRGPRSWGSRC